MLYRVSSPTLPATFTYGGAGRAFEKSRELFARGVAPLVVEAGDFVSTGAWKPDRVLGRAGDEIAARRAVFDAAVARLVRERAAERARTDRGCGILEIFAEAAHWAQDGADWEYGEGGEPFAPDAFEATDGHLVSVELRAADDDVVQFREADPLGGLRRTTDGGAHHGPWDGDSGGDGCGVGTEVAAVLAANPLPVKPLHAKAPEPKASRVPTRQRNGYNTVAR